MGSLDTFEKQRPHLLSLAYRMLSSSADAEDVVQEVWLRWQAADPKEVRNAKAWLSVATSRLCLDKLKAAQVRRDAYSGPWLPEPVATDASVDRESISLAFLVLLERLNPIERAVYLLHQVFSYTHGEIAQGLQVSEASVRQSFHRARAHVAENRPRFAPSEEAHARILGAFGYALAKGDVAALEEILTEDATLWADGGGKVRGAATRPVVGRGPLARFLVGLLKTASPDTHPHVDVQQVNGWPALVLRTDDRPFAVISIETDGERIYGVRNVVNPEKLGLPRIN